MSAGPTIIQNALHIPEDDLYLKSSHQHDYVPHTLRDGAYASVDGGDAYFRRGWSTGLRESGRIVDWSLTTNSSLTEVRAKLLWGCRGIDGKTPLFYRPISTLSRDHLAAIQRTQLAANPLHLEVVAYWLDLLNAARVTPAKTL